MRVGDRANPHAGGFLANLPTLIWRNVPFQSQTESSHDAALLVTYLG